MPARTLRLEVARNAYREIIRNRFSKADFVLVVDLDDANEREIDPGAVLSALEFLQQEESRAAAFANQAGNYTDMWALRHAEL